jgi:hypothetical protein
MYSFLVLGLIPGTNLQITFKSWLALAGWTVGAAIVYRYRNDLTPVAVAPKRTVLHASQLHHRA